MHDFVRFTQPDGGIIYINLNLVTSITKTADKMTVFSTTNPEDVIAVELPIEIVMHHISLVTNKGEANE